MPKQITTPISEETAAGLVVFATATPKGLTILFR